MPEISIYGKASQKTIKELEVAQDDLAKTLLEFLRSQQVPIASSCFGEGSCKRCIVNEEVLSCQITVNKFIQYYGSKIIIDYL